MIEQCELSKDIKAKGMKQTDKKQILPLVIYLWG